MTNRLLALAPWALAALATSAWWSNRRAPPPPPPPEPQPGLSRQTVAEPAVFEAQEPDRGRVAQRPRHIPWRGWRDILWRTWREVGEDRLTVVAGSVTYYALLAIFPALGVFVSLYGLIADVRTVQGQLTQLSTIFPPEAVRLLGEQMLRLANGEAAGLSAAFVVSLLLSIWSASAGMKSLFDGLNTAYDETEKRGFVALTAVTYGSTIAFLLLLTAVSAVLVAAPLHLRAEGMAAALWPMVYAAAAGAFAVIYRYGPSRQRPRWRWVITGSLVAAFLWMAAPSQFDKLSGTT